MPNFNRTVIFSSVMATIHMAHAADGTLILSTEPKQANVYIDGELKANVTPIYIDVPVGKRQVVVKQVGFKPQELEVLIVEKAILNQKVQLEPEKAPIPACDPNQLSLIRDPFETDDEFADRGFEVISQLNAGATRQDVACQAGVAKLNKAKYDLKTKIFPVEITWQPWTKELKLEAKGQIAIPKNQARSLWKEGVEKPVFVLFDQLNPTPTVNRMVLLGLQQQWEIKPDQVEQERLAKEQQEQEKQQRLAKEQKEREELAKQLIHERYRDNKDGTVTDVKTKLMWKRCSEGQTWSGSTCTGEATTMTWDAAVGTSWGEFAGHGDWRLPSKEELPSLVYCSSGKPALWKTTDGACEGGYQEPTIDQTAFPNTSNRFWTATPYSDNCCSWLVYFHDGRVDNGPRHVDCIVRVVRAGQRGRAQ